MYSRQLIAWAKGELIQANSRFGLQGEEEDDARTLLAHASGEPEPADEVPPACVRRFHRLVRRRHQGEPLAYIVGWVDFNGFRLGIRPGMFIPRLTSEFLARQAVRRLRGRRRPFYIDLATGIAPVAISVAKSVPRAQVWGVDISRRALDQARINAAALGASNVTFKKSDLFSALPAKLRGKIDVVTIHPPYVARRQVASLPVEVKSFEPRHTLSDSSVDGLGLVRRVASEGPGWLRPGGWLLVEIMPSESGRVRALMRCSGFAHVKSTCGCYRQTRVIVGRRL